MFKFQGPIRPLAAALALALHSPVQAATPIDFLFHISAVLPSAAPAVVTNCSDDNNVEGTLRKAIVAACLTNQPLVDMSRLQCSTITLQNGELVACSGLEATGPLGSITIDANYASRAFKMGDLSSLHNLKIKNGRSFDTVGGGCVFSDGELSLFNVAIDNCEAETPDYFTARGGAVYVKGDARIYSSKITHSDAYSHRHVRAEGGGVWGGERVFIGASEISDNFTKSDVSNPSIGGGIYARVLTSASYSTIARNSASVGGGAFAQDGVRMEESTVSDNTASNAAGIYSATWIQLYNSTIASNSVKANLAVGGVFSRNGPINSISSIVAGSFSSQNNLAAADLGAGVLLVVSGERNIIQSSQSQVPADTLSLDPLLQPLADNGGITSTQLLSSGSPALRHGINTLDFPTDQRGPGFARGSPGGVDIGATQDSLFACDFESVEGKR